MLNNKISELFKYDNKKKQKNNIYEYTVDTDNNLFYC